MQVRTTKNQIQFEKGLKSSRNKSVYWCMYASDEFERDGKRSGKNINSNSFMTQGIKTDEKIKKRAQSDQLFHHESVTYTQHILFFVFYSVRVLFFIMYNIIIQAPAL